MRFCCWLAVYSQAPCTSPTAVPCKEKNGRPRRPGTSRCFSGERNICFTAERARGTFVTVHTESCRRILSTLELAAALLNQNVRHHTWVKSVRRPHTSCRCHIPVSRSRPRGEGGASPPQSLLRCLTFTGVKQRIQI